MEFRPCIDLHNGCVKQIVGSSLRDDSATAVENFVSTLPPEYYAEMYRKDNLTGGHVIMLGQGNQHAARAALTAWPGGLQVGGGINAANARCWLDAGAAGVIVTSYIFSDGQIRHDRLNELVKNVGTERLILDLSCRKRGGRYFIVTDRWQNFTETEVNAESLGELAKSCSEFLIHAVDIEGKQAGIDETLITIIANSSPVPAVYAGGIRSLDDLKTIRRIGNGGVAYTVGSALDIFGGNLKYRDVVEFAHG
ncbi:MAG: phosphoribosylformimino-5-aminoimidazole carboxamide ribotide isomerase [Victivallaceae bacterium]|jgi:phosphoribosylformimino-5-aminoimidazole carboxamide ribotide isomerase|nr:phosphoribosylformimino-5-aminoimidazole carboxamide ribotide isomerase [Victivallaceae bacterium]MDD5663214.1 phosphoribosylformimino-5-aminoimidazole carboxamide ribotide isomerase [Victivallaceae bacterium]